MYTAVNAVNLLNTVTEVGIMLKAIVVYASRYGSTARAARAVAAKIGADVADVAKDRPELSGYEVVVLGSPIFIGNLPGRMKQYIAANSDTLAQKRLGLFICCAHQGEEAEKQLEAFPQELTVHAAAKAVLGGAVVLEKHNFLVRAMLKHVGIRESFTRLDTEALASFACELGK